MRRIATGLAALGAGVILNGCGGGDPGSAELRIDRPKAEERVVDPETGLVTRQFPIYPGFLTRELADVEADQIAPKPDPPDPFGGRTRRPVLVPARKILEAYGVEFTEGTSASYDKASEVLTVVQTPEWMDLVETVMDRAHTRELVINVRVEIFEVPAALAVRLEHSAGEHYDHSPELDALQEVVKSGEARFVTSVSLQCRSGQRSTCQATEEVIFFSGFSWDKSVEPARLKPEFDTRDVGTSLEVDAVAGPDRKTLDVNFTLEHHTAPPSWTSTTFPVPGAEEPAVVEIPHFHVKNMITNISLMTGDTKLLGSWRPTGLPRFEESDLMRVVFLRGDIQVLPIVGRQWKE